MDADKQTDTLLARPTKNRQRRWACVAAVAFVLLLVVPSFCMNRLTSGSRYDAMDGGWLGQVPETEVALVLGAGLEPDGAPSQYLAWRVETAADLYMAGKVRTLLMSGNAKNKRGSETAAMSRYAQDLGVTESDIVIDNAGYTTYESCYRAKRVFGYDEVTTVTQGYHVPRSVALCGGLGIKTVGVAAEHDRRDATVWYLLREMLATDKAVLQLVFKPEPATLNR